MCIAYQEIRLSIYINLEIYEYFLIVLRMKEIWM